jgi:hypothetical protein
MEREHAEPIDARVVRVMLLFPHWIYSSATSLMIARIYGQLGSSSVLGILSRPTTLSNSS